MYCSECGAKIDGAKFCPNCGTPTGKNSDASPKVTKKETKSLKNGTEKKKWSMPIVIAAVVLLVIIVILIYNLIRKDSPFDFPSTEESVEITKDIQGKWVYGTTADGCILTFESSNEFELIQYIDTDGVSSDTKFTTTGTYAIDSEKDIIYLIPEDKDADELDDAEDVIYDYDSDGSVTLYFDGNLLKAIQ